MHFLSRTHCLIVDKNPNRSVVDPADYLESKSFTLLDEAMLKPDLPALILAPMEGVTDAPMRSYQTASGAFTYCVSEFLRVSHDILPPKVFRRKIPELGWGAMTRTGAPVQIQILGGDAGRMAESAINAVAAGATAIDINFGCPAPTVNKHDGGASLLKYPARILEIVSTLRSALPPEVPLSAKLRLGWDSIDSIFENAAMVAEGGASWITIHARTRAQGYQPPVFWPHIGRVREQLSIPVVANGDIWNLDDFRRCQQATGCRHFMIGRGALANPILPRKIAIELGIMSHQSVPNQVDWEFELAELVRHSANFDGDDPVVNLMRLKQWIKLATKHGDFIHFDAVKASTTLREFFDRLRIAVELAAQGDPLSA